MQPWNIHESIYFKESKQAGTHIVFQFKNHFLWTTITAFRLAFKCFPICCFLPSYIVNIIWLFNSIWNLFTVCDKCSLHLMFSVARSFQKKKNIKKRLTKISYTIVMRSVSVFNRISRCFDKNIKKVI